jgi:hypothetical protein
MIAPLITRDQRQQYRIEVQRAKKSRRVPVGVSRWRLKRSVLWQRSFAARIPRLANPIQNAAGLRNDEPHGSNGNEGYGESFENPFHESLPHSA